MDDVMTVTPSEIAAFEQRLTEFAESLNSAERARFDDMMRRAVYGPDADTTGFVAFDGPVPSLGGFFAGPRARGIEVGA